MAKRFIVDQPALKHLHVSTRGHFKAVREGIHIGLFETKKWKRREMEITLSVDVREISNAADFVRSISKIVAVLGMCNIEEWMVCVDAKVGNHSGDGQQYFDWQPMAKEVHELVEFCPTIELLKATKSGFFIGNPGCRMTRHEPWWNKGIRIFYY